MCLYGYKRGHGLPRSSWSLVFGRFEFVSRHPVISWLSMASAGLGSKDLLIQVKQTISTIIEYYLVLIFDRSQ